MVQPPAACPRVAVGRQRSAPIQCRLVVESDVLRASEPVRVLVELRNVGDQVQTVGGILFEPFTLN